MGEVQRICPQCGQMGPVAVRYCPHCGHDSEAALPVRRSNLPMVIGRAALPVLAGAATLALRAGWKLIQSRTAQATARQAVTALANSMARPPAPTQPAPPSTAPARPRTTIHIRSSWAVGDANGVWQRGVSDHTIEVED